MNILLTGSSGYYGQILSKYLISHGHRCWGVDLIEPENTGLDGFSKLNIVDREALKKIFEDCKFSIVIHLASQIDFAVIDQKDLYSNNYITTQNIVSLSIEHRVKKIIFTSSNSIYLGNSEKKITEEILPIPVDEYGRSKLDSEELLKSNSDKIDVNIIRCPNIIDAGRVGMLSVLFELLECDSTLWVLKKGQVRHQTIYAEDLNKAISCLLTFEGSSTHNIGCDEVKNFADIFRYLINISNSKSRVRSIPSFLVIPLLELAYRMGISPLGPYQFRMLTRDFEFNTEKIKKELNWSPTKNNAEILGIAYQYYLKNKTKILNGKSANSGKVRLGILNILKFIRI
jgi:UDP-glucose 4-epimerase